MQDEGSFDSSSLKAYQNKSQIGCFCMYAMFLNVVKRMKFETICVFNLLGYCPRFQENKHFSGGKVCYKLSSLLMVNAEKWDAKLGK